MKNHSRKLFLTHMVIINQPLDVTTLLGFREAALKRKFRWVGNRWCDLVVLEKKFS